MRKEMLGKILKEQLESSTSFSLDGYTYKQNMFDDDFMEGNASVTEFLSPEEVNHLYYAGLPEDAKVKTYGIYPYTTNDIFCSCIEYNEQLLCIRVIKDGYFDHSSLIYVPKPYTASTSQLEPIFKKVISKLNLVGGILKDNIFLNIESYHGNATEFITIEDFTEPTEDLKDIIESDREVTVHSFSPFEDRDIAVSMVDFNSKIVSISFIENDNVLNLVVKDEDLA